MTGIFEIECVSCNQLYRRVRALKTGCELLELMPQPIRWPTASTCASARGGEASERARERMILVTLLAFSHAFALTVWRALTLSHSHTSSFTLAYAHFLSYANSRSRVLSRARARSMLARCALPARCAHLSSESAHTRTPARSLMRARSSGSKN